MYIHITFKCISRGVIDKYINYIRSLSSYLNIHLNELNYYIIIE